MRNNIITFNFCDVKTLVWFLVRSGTDQYDLLLSARDILIHTISVIID